MNSQEPKYRPEEDWLDPIPRFGARKQYEMKNVLGIFGENEYARVRKALKRDIKGDGWEVHLNIEEGAIFRINQVSVGLNALAFLIRDAKTQGHLMLVWIPFAMCEIVTEQGESR